MKIVHDEKYYHIQRRYPQKYSPRKWEIAEKIKVGTRRNYYYDWFYTYCPFYHSYDKKKYPISQVVKEILSYYKNQEEGKNPKIDPSLYEDLVSILKLVDNGISYTTELLRELVFEHIRQKRFPNYPSRHNCLFAIPNDKDSLEYWKKRYMGEFEGIIVNIYLLSLTGKIHRANTKYLNNDIVDLREYENNAINYWSGNDIGISPLDEILFEGEILIEKIFEIEKL